MGYKHNTQRADGTFKCHTCTIVFRINNTMVEEVIDGERVKLCIQCPFCDKTTVLREQKSFDNC